MCYGYGSCRNDKKLLVIRPILEEKTIQLRKKFSDEEFLTSEGCL